MRRVREGGSSDLLSQPWKNRPDYPRGKVTAIEESTSRFHNEMRGGIHMSPKKPPMALPMQQLVVVRPEPSGQFLAQLVGLPELQACAGTREEAIDQVRQLLSQWLDSGQLAVIDVPQDHLLKQWQEWAQADPEYNLYVEEIRRIRQEEDERGRTEKTDPPCLPSSSTRTT
jgi:hypothetical protein